MKEEFIAAPTTYYQITKNEEVKLNITYFSTYRIVDKIRNSALLQLLLSRLHR